MISINILGPPANTVSEIPYGISGRNHRTKEHSVLNDKLIKSISPIPVPAQLFLAGPPIAFFVSLFPAMFTFVISNMIAGISGGLSHHSGPVVVYGLVVFCLAFVMTMAWLAAKCFLEPEKTEYRIFNDRVEYEEGLLNKQKRTLMLDQVIDVTQTQSVLQQTVGAGTVSLITQQLTSAGDGKLSNRTIAIRNIPNSDEVYEVLRGLANQN